MSTFLLDTHTWLWMQDDRGRLRPRSRQLVQDAGNELLLSVASIWEISIKHATGRLQLPEAPETYVVDRMRRTRVDPLQIAVEHAIAAGALPALHKDPFDRMIIAQARALGIPIITVDRKLAAYDVEIIDS